MLDFILQSRGLESDAFLNPKPVSYWIQNLPAEFLTSLNNCCQIIQDAMSANMPIVIHGDYDVDGICATRILFTTLNKRLNYPNASAFLPNRFEHGYGFSKKSIDAILQKFENPQNVLFITVDSGITSVEDVAYAKSLGHRVIITDHHQKPDILPDADCILWYDQIVGSTISWLLSRALCSEVEDELAYCALATVTDLQPLIDFNRSIVKFGLEKMNSQMPLGLKKLLELSGKLTNEVTTYELGWVLGPRLNASGRLIDATKSLELLLAEDEVQALELAHALNEINTGRQDKTLQMYEMASVASNVELPKIIISYGADYHEGVIGLVAAKLAQKYYRPAIVISTADEVAKGSVRSVPGINIIEMLRVFEELFENVGGHPMAAGFSIKKENIPVLQDKLLAHAAGAISEELLVPTLEVDLKIPLEIIKPTLLDDMSLLKPFGLGNREPVFASFDVGVTSVSFVGREGKHLSLRLFDGKNFCKAIWFGAKDILADKGFNIVVGDKIDLAYNLKENNYNGQTYVDLVVKDINKS